MINIQLISNNLQEVLNIHSIISIELAKKASCYTIKQRKIFRIALDLIDELDLMIDLNVQYKDRKKLNLKLYKKLFSALRRLKMDELIIKKISSLEHTKQFFNDEWEENT